MNPAHILQALDYDDSERFVTPDQAEKLPPSELSFALRHLARSFGRLQNGKGRSGFLGAYVLQQEPGAPAVPVTYVFEVESDAEAREIHRTVWNQSLVPFLIVSSPSTVRVYPGFSFSSNKEQLLVQEPAGAGVLAKIEGFNAASIDEGRIWEEWGQTIDPTQKADERLLSDLVALDRLLQEKGVPTKIAHGLIGKYVYLHYLRDRNILSVRKLEKWNLSVKGIFSRDASIRDFRRVNEQLQAWLNGSVFSLAEDAVLGEISQDQLQLVAGTFCGDSPETKQLHLDFPAYNFSHIPIETLSCVYEQFLHAPSGETKPSRGKSLGAYYTPIPLADYMVSEMDRTQPLTKGKAVLDPSCGSGVFLVQCYRRLIERKMREENRRLKAPELRSILKEQIFGIDRDPDACRVAELSLILTLLDYVDPPDLESTNFKLPSLRQTNIHQEDFFALQGKVATKKFDWIVGNPPWTEIRGRPAESDEQWPAWQWMRENEAESPTSGKQLAEAFLWKAGEHLTPDGAAGLLLPAMTFFKKEGERLRKRFFGKREVWCLANFANMAYVLFGGRAEVPAAAIFFKPVAPAEGHMITTFAPLVAEQIANRPQSARKQLPTWNIVVNGSELREVPNLEAAEGKGTTWKIGMWGATRDQRLLDRVSKRFPNFMAFTNQREIVAHEGVQLRGRHASEPVEYRSELIGRKSLNSKALRRIGRIFDFPEVAVSQIEPEDAYIRKSGGTASLSVIRPPHVILDASRRFAVFSDDFLIVPPRQVGIAGSTGSEQLLRAFSLYLSSDFFIYQQFLTSPQWGISVNRADLAALKKLPIPLEGMSDAELASWSDLQKNLAELSRERFKPDGQERSDGREFRSLLQELNQKVYAALQLRPSEQWLVEDFVNVNLELNKGKVSPIAVRKPEASEIIEYLTALRDCLDGFISPERGLRHQVDAITDARTALFSVSLQSTREAVPPRLLSPDQETAATLLTLRDNLRRQHSQWVYFDRALKIYHEGSFYQFKPLQRHHWTRRQAVLDSDEIIAETMMREAAS